jgi:hypothetical protein
VSALTRVSRNRSEACADQLVIGLYDGLVVRTVPLVSNSTRNVRARYNLPASTHRAGVRHAPPGADGMSVNPHDRLSSVVQVTPSTEACSET